MNYHGWSSNIVVVTTVARFDPNHNPRLLYSLIWFRHLSDDQCLEIIVDIVWEHFRENPPEKQLIELDIIRKDLQSLTKHNLFPFAKRAPRKVSFCPARRGAFLEIQKRSSRFEQSTAFKRFLQKRELKTFFCFPTNIERS